MLLIGAKPVALEAGLDPVLPGDARTCCCTGVGRRFGHKLNRIVVDHRLYATSARTLIAIIETLDHEFERVMLVGYNQGPADLARHSSNELIGMPAFALRTFDNIGVQHGLAALNAGAITTTQFLDLNRYIGGYDQDEKYIPQRTVGDAGAIRRACSTRA